MNSLSKIVAIIIGIFLFLLYPLYQQAQKHDELSQTVVHNAVTEFVDAARTKGFISPTMYSEFSQKLAATGNVFDIEISHLHKKYNPLYTDPADPNTFQKSFEAYYDGFYTDEIMKVLYPDQNIPEDSETRKYKLSLYDYLSVKVTNRNTTMAQVIQNSLFGLTEQGASSKIFVPYGGMVLNEDY
ncbi:hypothetical protein RB298_04895 [Priestia sp. BR_2]